MTLFKMMNFDPKMYDIFKELSITEGRDLVQIIKSIKTVILEGVGVMIFPVYAKYRSVLEYMSLEYPVVNIDEYAKILTENEYSDQSVYNYQIDLLENKDYYRINDTDYVLKSKINVDKNIINVAGFCEETSFRGLYYCRTVERFSQDWRHRWAFLDNASSLLCLVREWIFTYKKRVYRKTER
jgi:hypothetical protein